MIQNVCRIGVKWALIMTASLACGLACSSKKDSPGPVDLPTDEERTHAATMAANNDSRCNAIAPFYWEIGRATGVVAHGTTGDGSVTETTAMKVDAAGDLFFAAYVVKKQDGNLSAAQEQLLQMRGGYTSFTSCDGAPDVTGCFTASSNSLLTPANVGLFSFGQGHIQKLAVDLNLGDKTASQLVTEIQSELGTDIDFTYSTPNIGGGLNITSENYALFLRHLLSDDYEFTGFLGMQKTCTRPTICSTAHYTPLTYSWRYSYGHWVEDDLMTGDGSYSSPGLRGFYPWVSGNKDTYGLLARDNSSTTAMEDSIGCGHAIRDAFFTGRDP
jgi:hypothetical protein